MPRRPAAPTKDKIKVYGWPVTSSTEREGRNAKYFVWMYADGHLSCDCPGWIFHRKKNGDMCKHTRSVLEESKDLLKRHRRGEELPLVTGEDTITHRSTGALTPTTTVKFGRLIEV